MAACRVLDGHCRVLAARATLRWEIAMRTFSLAAFSAAALVAGAMAPTVGSPVSRNNVDAASAMTSAADTTTQSTEVLKLSDAQRKMAWQDLYMDSLNQETPPDFNPVVGASVPNTIVIAPVTAQAGSDVPGLKPFSFAMVQKKLVIVNPSSRRIANVIAQ
jgi:Protein of unknown function (DUF1236)